MSIWLERFVLGGVCVAAFTSMVILNILKFDWNQRITLGGAILLFSYFIGHTIEKQRQPISPSSASSTQSTSPSEVSKASAANQPPPMSGTASRPHATPPHNKRQPASPLHPLTSFSDGQRFLLKQKLGAYAGNTVRLVLIGSDAEAGIVFDQLIDIFRDAGWKIQTARIGMVSIVGANFPSVPYLTGPNIAAPSVRNVFSIFAGIGIDLPLTPDAFAGPGSMGTPPDVTLVVK